MTISDKWIRTKADERAVDEGCTFDEDKGRKVCDFIEKYVVPTRGFGAERPAKLLDWQAEDFIVPLFSWLKPNGFRRFREACLFVPRQNGKSFLCSAISLYMLCADNEPGASILCMGTTSEQTQVVFGEIQNSVEANAKLRQALNVKKSTREIEYPARNGRLKGVSNEGWGKLGNPPHCAVLDEFCFWPSYTPYTAIKHGTGSRKQPLTLAISTSGTKRDTPAYALWQLGERIISGLSLDTSLFPLIYQANSEDPIDSPTTWKKCNPSLGVTIHEDEFRTWAERAKESKIEELHLRQFKLNQWCSTVNQFLNLDSWQACTNPTFPEFGEDDQAFISVDLSTTTDLTSVVTVLPRGEQYFVEHHSFCCQKGVEASEKQNLVKYHVFEQEGVLTVHDGNSIDFEDVRAYIRNQCDKYNVRVIAFDPSHNANDTMLILQADGLPVERYYQGPKYFNQPMRRLNELVLDGKIQHKGDSLINWQAGNLESKKDHNDMLTPTKPSDAAKIDTMVALLMALSKTVNIIAEEGEDTGEILWW